LTTSPRPPACSLPSPPPSFLSSSSASTAAPRLTPAKRRGGRTGRARVFALLCRGLGISRCTAPQCSIRAADPGAARSFPSFFPPAVAASAAAGGRHGAAPRVAAPRPHPAGPLPFSLTPRSTSSFVLRTACALRRAMCSWIPSRSARARLACRGSVWGEVSGVSRSARRWSESPGAVSVLRAHISTRNVLRWRSGLNF
jgi:hypothetical protein